MKKKTILILIFTLAFFLRVYKLGSYPVGFLWDEAALGYNAFSILKTGRDEYGKLLPIIVKSFGDYKPGLYVYLTVPSVAIFGLNEFSVRLPSAIFGSFTVLMLYFLIKEGQRLKGKDKESELLPIVAAFLLTISPWHLSFSRGAWELNVMTFELILGFYLLFRYLNDKKGLFLHFSVVVFLLSLITYQSTKFLVPLLLLSFVFFFRESIKPIDKKVKIKFASIFLVGYLIFNYLTVAGGKAGRIKVMSLFSYPRSTDESKMLLEQDKGNRVLFDLFHSSPPFFIRSVLGRYFNHFSEKFLFYEGDWSNPRNGIAYQGVMYFIDFFLLVIGFGTIFSRKRIPLENFMLFWLLVAPLSSALTRDSISSVRSFPMVIPLAYFSATGLGKLIVFFEGRKTILKFMAYGLWVMAYGFCFIRMVDLYFIHDPKINSDDRLYGYKQMANYIKPLVNSKKEVVITTKYGQPYIFYLFYTGYDPQKYQAQAVLKEDPYGDVGEVEKIDNIEFRRIYWPQDRGMANSLFVGNEFDLPLQDIVGQENIYFLEEIKFLNEKTAFRIVETK